MQCARIHRVWIEYSVDHVSDAIFRIPHGVQSKALQRSRASGKPLSRDQDRENIHEAAALLKRALFLSAFAALRDPISRTYYARKISQGKRHNQALIALARRRCDVLFAMLRDGTLYSPPPAELH